MYFPMNYEKVNNLNARYIPQNVKTLNTEVFKYWERSLFQRAESVLEFTGLPDEWSGAVKDFFLYCLFRFGFIGVWDDEEVGLVFNPGTLSGYNFYYQPTEFLVANPTLSSSRKLKIGEETELIKLTPDYMGIWDVIAYYAEKLATLDSAINMAIINSKLAWILGAKNKAVAETLKKVYDRINKGDPLVIFNKMPDDPVSKSEPFQFIDRDVKRSYITTELLNDFQTIINNFDCEIGIPTIPYQKKERLVTSEADSKVIDSISRVTVWMETLNDSLALVNKKYNLDISVKLRFDPEAALQEESEVSEDE